MLYLYVYTNIYQMDLARFSEPAKIIRGWNAAGMLPLVAPCCEKESWNIALAEAAQSRRHHKAYRGKIWRPAYAL